MKKKKNMRLVVDVHPTFHMMIKKRALESGLTMRAYILKVLMEKEESQKRLNNEQ